MLARGEFTHLEPGPRPGLLLAAAKPAAVVAFDLASVRLDRGAR
jgi:hypothetical protein